jgi:hypothetical protein
MTVVPTHLTPDTKMPLLEAEKRYPAPKYAARREMCSYEHESCTTHNIKFTFTPKIVPVPQQAES